MLRDVIHIEFDNREYRYPKMTAEINAKPLKRNEEEDDIGVRDIIARRVKAFTPFRKEKKEEKKKEEGRRERERERIKEEKSGRRGEKVGWRMAGRRDCYGGRTGKVGAFCPRGLAIKISIRFPRELSQPFLRPSSHLASVFSPLIKLHPRRANGGSTGLQRTHFVIISFNDEGSCHPSLCLLPLPAPYLPPLRNIFIACPRLDGRDATEFHGGGGTGKSLAELEFDLSIVLPEDSDFSFFR